MAYYPPTDRELKDFFREHADAVYRSCGFLTCGKADTQRMVKDIFLKLLKNGMIFTSDKDAKAWMILTAYKLSRKASKYAPTQEQEISEQQPETTITEDDNASSAEQTACDETVVSASCETSETEAPEREEESDPQEVAPAIAEESAAQTEGETAVVTAPMVFPQELQKLSRRDRLIALLYYCEGYRKSEIASYLGVTTFMIGSRLKRIKKRILQESGGETAC